MAIIMDDRFFCRFGKIDQALTAYYLAGAKIYALHNKKDLSEDLKKLKNKYPKKQIYAEEITFCYALKLTGIPKNILDNSDNYKFKIAQ